VSRHTFIFDWTQREVPSGISKLCILFFQLVKNQKKCLSTLQWVSAFPQWRHPSGIQLVWWKRFWDRWGICDLDLRTKIDQRVYSISRERNHFFWFGEERKKRRSQSPLLSSSSANLRLYIHPDLFQTRLTSFFKSSCFPCRRLFRIVNASKVSDEVSFSK